MSILRVRDNQGRMLPIPAIQGPPGISGTIDPATATTLSGLLKGDGQTVSAAVPGTDYAAPEQLDAKLDKTGGTVSGMLYANGGLSVPVTGTMLKTSAAGLVASAAAGVDYVTPEQLRARITWGTTGPPASGREGDVYIQI